MARRTRCPSYLVLGVRLEQEDVNGRQLADEPVALKLLPHAVADDGDGHGHVIHGLYLRRLISGSHGQHWFLQVSRASSACMFRHLPALSSGRLSVAQIAQFNPVAARNYARGQFKKHTPLIHSR